MGLVLVQGFIEVKMGTFAKERTKYNILKDGRYYRATGIYDYRNSLRVYVQAGADEPYIANKSSTTTLRNVSLRATADSPDVKFPFRSFELPDTPINENNIFFYNPETGAPGEGPYELLPNQGLLISFWARIDKHAHASHTNGGNCYLEYAWEDSTDPESTRRRKWTVFSNGVSPTTPGQFGIRFYGLNDTWWEVKTANTISLGWNHFIIYIPQICATDGVGTLGPLTGANTNSANTHGKTPQIFVNGSAFSLASPTVYGDDAADRTIRTQGAHPAPIDSAKLFFGYGSGRADSGTGALTIGGLDGAICELAIFQGTDIVNLSENSLKYLYRASVKGDFTLKSGFLNIPRRAKIREMDDKGFFPTQLHGIDHTRKGDHKIRFDESTLPVDSTKGSVNYPTKLNTEDPLLANFVYNFYVDGKLDVPIEDPLGRDESDPHHLGQHIVSVTDDAFNIHNYIYPGNTHTASIEPVSENSVYDEFYERNDRPTLPAFYDCKTLDSSGSQFHLTETSYTGHHARRFHSQSLESKHQIFIEMYQEDGSDLTLGSSYATGETALGGDVTHMAYYNFSNSRFEARQAYTYTGKDTSEQTYLDGQCAISPGIVKTIAAYEDSGLNLYPDNYYNSIGIVTSMFGFPTDKKYDASSGQAVLASEFISGPFLLEKLIVEIDDVELAVQDKLNKLDPQASPSQPSRQTDLNIYANSISAFLLKEYPDPLENDISVPLIGLPDPGTGIASQGTFDGGSGKLFKNVDKFNLNRDLLAVGKSVFYFTDTTSYGADAQFFEGNLIHKLTASNYDGIYKAGDISTESGTPSGGHSTNNRFKIHFEPCVLDKVVFGGTYTYPENNGATDNRLPYIWDGGVSSGFHNFSNCSFGPSVAEDGPKTTISNYPGSTFAGSTINIEVNSTPQRSKVPVIILPKDKLIFGICHDVPPNSEKYYRSFMKLVSTSRVRFRLFGSYMQLAKPKPPKLNQTPQFTKSLIPEFMNEIHDQWDISYRSEFSGSIHDTYISASSPGPNYTNTTVIYPPEATNPGLTMINDEGEGIEEPSPDSFYVYSAFESGVALSPNFDRRRDGFASNGTIGSRGALQRNIRLYSDTEYEADSIYYDLKKIWDHDSAAYINMTTTSQEWVTLGSASGYNETWPITWPYSQAYVDVAAPKVLGSLDETRDRGFVLMKNNAVLPLNEPAESGGTTSPNTSETGLNYIDFLDGFVRNTNIPGFGGPGSAAIGVGLQLVDIKDLNLDQLNASSAYENNAKILLGFGNGRSKLHYVLGYEGKADGASNTYTNAAYQSGGIKPPAGKFRPFHAIVDSIRGTKYGISNALPKKLTAVFDRRSYGQFSNMMQTSCDTKTVYRDTNTNELVFNASPVQIKFISSQLLGITLSGAESKRQNADSESKVQYPYREDVAVETANDTAFFNTSNEIYADGSTVWGTVVEASVDEAAITASAPSDLSMGWSAYSSTTIGEP